MSRAQVAHTTAEQFAQVLDADAGQREGQRSTCTGHEVFKTADGPQWAREVGRAVRLHRWVSPPV